MRWPSARSYEQRGHRRPSTERTQSMTLARRVAVTAAALALGLAGTATAAFIGLPADGSQVNNDPANGIDPARDAGLSDVVGGSLAGGVPVPWAAFEQKTAAEQQIFVRAFKGGQWVTQGKSLNIDPNQE